MDSEDEKALERLKIAPVRQSKKAVFEEKEVTVDVVLQKQAKSCGVEVVSDIFSMGRMDDFNDWIRGFNSKGCKQASRHIQIYHSLDIQ